MTVWGVCRRVGAPRRFELVGDLGGFCRKLGGAPEVGIDWRFFLFFFWLIRRITRKKPLVVLRIFFFFFFFAIRQRPWIKPVITLRETVEGLRDSVLRKLRSGLRAPGRHRRQMSHYRLNDLKGVRPTRLEQKSEKRETKDERTQYRRIFIDTHLVQ